MRVRLVDDPRAEVGGEDVRVGVGAEVRQLKWTSKVQTRGVVIAEGLRDASYRLKSRQLLRNIATITSIN